MSTIFVQECGQSVFAYSFSVLRTFLRLFDVMIVSWLYFLMFLLIFFIAYFCVPLLYVVYRLPFPTISRHFIIGACVGDDIIDFSGLFIALATRS